MVTLSNNDRLTVVSLGSEKNSKGNKSAATKLAATLARLASAHKAATIIVEAPEEFTNDKDAMKAFTTGLYGALYTDNRYR